MIIVTDLKFVLEDEWELFEVQDMMKTKDTTTIDELWINRRTQEQEIIKRKIKNNGIN